MQRQGGRQELWDWVTTEPALQAAPRSAPVVRANTAGEQTQQEGDGAFGSLQLASSVDTAADHGIPVVFLLKSCKAVALHSFQ